MIIKIHNHCQFEPSNSLSFQGFCKWCGKEQSEHSRTMSNNKQSSVTQLIEEIKRRVSIIQSEPQTMERELMIDNLVIDLEKYEVIHKEEMVEFANDFWTETDSTVEHTNAEIFYNKIFKSEQHER